MKFDIEYKLDGVGWATIIISNEEASYESSVSYLNDSLSELAQLAIDLKNGLHESKVIFMGEPGELQLLVTFIDDVATYEARWFDDWVSSGMHPESAYEVVLSGKFSSSKVIQQISSILRKIYQNIGEEQYKEMWIEHEFPLNKFKELTNE